jgi:hypothetical protein
VNSFPRRAGSLSFHSFIVLLNPQAKSWIRVTTYTSLKTGAFLFLLAVQVQAEITNKTTLAILAKTSIAAATTLPTVVAAASTTAALDPNVTNCFLALPNQPLTAAGLSTPFLLHALCSQTVATQQAFAEAAIYDPATGTISIYHPPVPDAGKTAGAPPVVPAGTVVALWFRFNGWNSSTSRCQRQGNKPVTHPESSGMYQRSSRSKGDVFGQVSWCNAASWFSAANAGIASGKAVIPPLGVDKLGNPCPTSRPFEITDACPPDNVPTQHLLLPDGSTAQDNAGNRAAHHDAQVITNASDEALLTNILDPLIGCTPYVAP